jgi:ferredoxin-NADP reductase
MAMLRLARRLGVAPKLHLVVSVRRAGDLYYSDELPGPEATVVYTRATPPGSDQPPGRITAEDLAPIVHGDDTVYICGSSPFADAAATLVVAAGIPIGQIRVERFGPTG